MNNPPRPSHDEPPAILPTSQGGEGCLPPAFGDNASLARVTAFFTQLETIARRFVNHPNDPFDDAPVAMVLLALPAPRVEHQTLAAQNPTTYDRLAHALTHTATQLADRCTTPRDLQLTLDWIVSAPDRLLTIAQSLRRECQDPFDGDD